MAPQKQPTQAFEAGLLCFLFMAMAVVAAVTYVIVYTSDHKNDRSYADQAPISAMQVMQVPYVIEKALQKMKSDGIPLAQVDFKNNAVGQNAIFHPDGGGVIVEAVPLNVQVKKMPWLFLKQKAGTQSLMVMLNHLTLPVCCKINENLGLSPRPKIEKQIVSFEKPGTMINQGIVDFVFTDYLEKRSACIQNGERGSYFYYSVLDAE